MKELEEYIAYKQMLGNPNTLVGFYGIDSKVRELHKKLIDLIDIKFEGKLIVDRLNWIFDNIDKVLSKNKGLNFFKDDAKEIADDLYYWIFNNARVKNWLTIKNVKKPEWF